jgi:hypothetical protein
MMCMFCLLWQTWPAAEGSHQSLFNLLFDYDRVPTASQMATDKLTAMNRNGNGDRRQQVRPIIFFFLFSLFFNLLFDYDRVPTVSQTATDKPTATNGDRRQQMRSTFVFLSLFFNLLFDYDRVLTPSQMATDKPLAMNGDELEQEWGPQAAGAPNFPPKWPRMC